jgi:Fe-S oxidoreductase
MAGSFGYEHEHHEISMRIASLVLLPWVENLPPGSLVAAAGTSCRHQIHDGSARTALHPARILRNALTVKP